MKNAIKYTAIACMSALLLLTTASMAETDRAYYKKYKKHFISEQQAEQIAQARVNGATVDKVEFERENGIPYFDVKLHNRQGQKLFVRVDAKFGKIVKISRN